MTYRNIFNRRYNNSNNAHNNSDYVHYYGISLLDDLHNYFPDTLYNSSRFTNVQQLLNYIQLMTRRRFNLYDNALTQYNNETRDNINNYSTSIPQTYIRRPPVYYTTHYPTATATTNINTQVNTTSDINTNSMSDNATNTTEISDATNTTQTNLSSAARTIRTLNDILSLFSATQPYTDNTIDYATIISTLEPVIIAPTQSQIQEATRLYTYNIHDINNHNISNDNLEQTNTNNNDICSICQYNFTNGDEVREIMYCHHSFHNQCISTWFRLNTKCPICRHDIRLIDSDDDI
jgi:hypothetical protein